MLQPRFERRASHSALALLEQPRFRAGLDFLRLRGEVGEADPSSPRGGRRCCQASDDERRDMLDGVREQRGRAASGVDARVAARCGRRDHAGERARTFDAGSDADDAPVRTSDAGGAPDAAAPRKRRRRRAGQQAERPAGSSS